MGPSWPVRHRICFPERASQILTVRSSDPETILEPSELNATESTPSSCPARRRRTFPEAASQMRTVRSEDPDAIRWPSGANRTVMPDEGLEGGARFHVPQADGPIGGSGEQRAT